MEVIIIGAGKVGYTLAKYLSREEDNITIIDNNLKALDSIMEGLDVMGIKGDGSSLKILHEAGVGKADLVISVTNSDEVNMLCCLIAKKLGAKYTIARVRAPQYSEEISMLKEELEIDLVINPEKEAALEIAKLIKFPSVSIFDTFAKVKVELVSFIIQEDDNFNGVRIVDTHIIKKSILLCGIERGDQVYIPSGDFVLRNDDKVYIIGEHKKIEVFLKKLGRYQNKIKNPLIVGGGRVAHDLIEIINDLGIRTKIIESDYEKCKELNESLPDTIVIHGDGTDQELLLSESLDEADAFIALTGRDEENIISSLFAIKSEVKTVITKITRFNYNLIAQNIGIDSIISPKEITANKILKYIRLLKTCNRCYIENVYKIFNEKAEAVEFLINEESKLLNTPIKDLNIDKNVIIGTIIRGNKIIIPSGDDRISIGDKVVVITKDKRLLNVNDIIAGGARE